MPVKAIETYKKALNVKDSPLIISTMRVVVETSYKELLKVINVQKYNMIYKSFLVGKSDPTEYSKKVRNAIENEISSRCFTTAFNLLNNSSHESMTKEEGDLLLSVFENEWREIMFYVKKYLNIDLPHHGIISLNDNKFFLEYYNKISDLIYGNADGNPTTKNKIYYFVEEVKIIIDAKGNIIFENIARAFYQKRGNKSTKITFYSKQKLVPSNCYWVQLFTIEAKESKEIKFLYAKQIEYRIKPSLRNNIEKVFTIPSLVGSEFNNLMDYLFERSISLFSFLNFDEKTIRKIYNEKIKNLSKDTKKILDSIISMHKYIKRYSHGRLLVYSLDDEIHNRMLYDELDVFERYDEIKKFGKRRYSNSGILHTGLFPFDKDPIICNPYGTKLPINIKVDMVTGLGLQAKYNFRLSIIYYAIRSVMEDFNNELLLINDEIINKINWKIGKFTKKIETIEEFKNIINKINNETKLSDEFSKDFRLQISKDSIIIKEDIIQNKDIYENLIALTCEHNYDIDSNKVINDYESEMNNLDKKIDSKKVEALKTLENKKMLIINGAAGTGKSLLLRFVSKLYSPEEFDIFAVAQTNAAKENLDLIVPNFVRTYTTTKFINDLSNTIEKKLVIILDEASVISNKMFKQILFLKPDVLVIAGDYYQLPSIDIGNWFETLCEIKYINKIELSNNFRSNDDTGRLNSMWEAFRNRKSDKFMGLLRKDNFLNFNDSINPFDFLKDLVNKKETSIVSLGYSGILGVNNCNYIIQLLNNPNKDIVNINGLEFKEGDKIIFDTNSTPDSYFYNNLKGEIIKIVEEENQIKFHIKTTRSSEISRCFFGSNWVTLISCEKIDEGYNVILMIKIDKYDSQNEKGVFRPPFHISYSNSIHKSQGLEYDTIIVVTSPNMEDMDFNILYTAITRARKKFILLTNPDNLSANITRIFEETPKTDTLLKKIILSNTKYLESFSEA